MKYIVLITGCSSGFGFHTALKFARAGHTTFASVKDLHEAGVVELQRISEEEQLPLHTVEIDVTNEEQIQQQVANIISQTGRIDVLINNAGFGFIGPIEDFSLTEVQQQYDVNVYGVIRMIKYVLPHMRLNKFGRIINVSSINGLLSFPLYGIYSSSKFAIETISEVLRFEVRPFGIQVSLVEPGGFNTGFSKHGKTPIQYGLSSVYKDLKNPLASDGTEQLKQNKIMQRVIDPQHVATLIFDIVNKKHLKLRYRVGIDSHLYYIGHKFMPHFIWNYLLRKVYRW